MLFINIFGTWHGSFGVNTAAGELNGQKADADSSTAIKAITIVPRVLKKTVTTLQSHFGYRATNAEQSTEPPTSERDRGVILGDATKDPQKVKLSEPENAGNWNDILSILGLGLGAGLVVQGTDSLRARSKRSQK